jgi:hypothetical protein
MIFSIPFRAKSPKSAGKEYHGASEQTIRKFLYSRALIGGIIIIAIIFHRRNLYRYFLILFSLFTFDGTVAP